MRFITVPTFLAITFICIALFLLQKFHNSQPPHRSVLIGVWTEEFWDNQTKTLHVKKIHQFEKNIDKKVTITNYYRGWDELDNPHVAKELHTMSSHGWTPMLSTNPYLTPKCTPSTGDIYTAIAAGNCDKLIHSIAKVMKLYGKPLFLRFAWEMNIETNEWSIQSTYSNPKAFIAAWKHMHTIFNAEKVKNVRWVFSVNVESQNSVPIESLYPGDQYVDWTGIDGYNYGTTQSWSHWASFDEVFQKTYKKILSIAPHKPLMISEFNSVSIGGNKSEWFRDMFDVQLPQKYPKIQAIIFFNENKMKTEGVDWRIETSSAVLDTIKKSLKDPLYTVSVP